MALSRSDIQWEVYRTSGMCRFLVLMGHVLKADPFASTMTPTIRLYHSLPLLGKSSLGKFPHDCRCATRVCFCCCRCIKGDGVSRTADIDCSTDNACLTKSWPTPDMWRSRNLPPNTEAARLSRMPGPKAGACECEG